MKLYPSYVAEAQARQRRRLTTGLGLVGAATLIGLALWALVRVGVLS